MVNVEGKIAVVTGGSIGIGQSTVRVFSEHGVRCFFSYNRHGREAEILAEETGAVPVRADLETDEGCHDFQRGVFKETDRIDILVQNAGIWTYGTMGTMTPDVWQTMFRVNLDAVFHLTNSFVPAMQNGGGGSIILVSSTAARRGEAHHSHYAASKGALHSMAKSLAAELGPMGIRTNVVAPGWVDTPMSREELSRPGRREEIEQTIPLRRIPPPEDIAYPILFLASDWARHINGAILDVNGGAVLIGG